MKAVEHWATTRSGKIVAGVLCVALVAWLGGKMSRRVIKDGGMHRLEPTDPKRNFSDYEVCLIGGRAVLNGQDMYAVRAADADRQGYTLPAWCALCMVPFELMGYTASSLAWPLLSLAALAASSYWCLKIVRGADRPVPWPVWVVPPLLALRALDSNAGQAQVNVLILALSALGLYLYVRGRGLWAGVVLAAAMLTKPIPGLFLVYFAWKRQWRVVVGGLVGAVVLALVVPMPVLGLRGGYDSGREWLEERVFHFATASAPRDGYVPGQTLRPLVHRLLTESQAAAHSDRLVRVNIASVSPRTAEWIYRALAGLVILVLAVACFGRGARQDVERTAAELSLVAAAMLLVSPFARKGTFVVLVLPMTFAYSRLALAEAWSWRDRVLLGATIACFLLTGLTARGVVGKAASVHLTALTCMGWGAIALFVGLFVTIWGLPRASASSQPTQPSTGP